MLFGCTPEHKKGRKRGGAWLLASLRQVDALRVIEGALGAPAAHASLLVPVNR